MNTIISGILIPESGTTQLLNSLSQKFIYSRYQDPEGQGVLLSFSSSARSDTTILVKAYYMEQPLIKFVNLMAG